MGAVAKQELDRELKKLLVGTNDQRRRVGQTLYHFYRTLVFWREKGLSFFEITRAWSAGGAAVFDAMANTLRELGGPEQDERLRAFLAAFLEQLAGDVERGDHMIVPFLRWLEGCFAEVTDMMRSEASDSRIYDVALADLLGSLFVRVARAERAEMAGLLRAARAEL